MLGDLAEEFSARCRKAGAGPARRWYRRHVVRSLLPAARRRVGGRVDRVARAPIGSTRKRQEDMMEMGREITAAARRLLRAPGFTG
ncbi:MAG TPA: hypothetical protein VE173_04240, partial [Longimicrobiales bacterium]|nr:hypothetical protein [Longimicrobiales bacterium]